MSTATAKKRGVLSTPPGLFNEPLAGRQVRLSDPEMKPYMDELKARIQADPAFARKMLRDAGIMNNKGKLAKAFGG